MDKIYIYTLQTKEGTLAPYFMTSTSHEEMKKFSVNYFSKMVDSVKNKQEQRNMLEDLRTMSFVCVGFVCLETGKMESDLQTLYTLDNFRSDITFDDVKKEKQMSIEDFGVEVEDGKQSS